MQVPYSIVATLDSNDGSDLLVFVFLVKADRWGARWRLDGADQIDLLSPTETPPPEAEN
jgi:hypothetical protein